MISGYLVQINDCSTMRILIILCLINLLIFPGCREEEKYEFPIIQTGEVVEITSTGVIFYGKILNDGDEKILDHGFVWDINPDPLVNENSYIKSLGPVSSDIFSAKITSAFISGQNYYLRAYVINDSHIIYGRTVSFKSLGSSTPTITGLFPETATWGDTLIITGANFSWKTDENKVEFGNFNAEVVDVEDSKLAVLIPEDLDTSNISIKLSYQNYSIVSDDKFSLIPPEIRSINPIKGTFGDSVNISGNYFNEGKTQFYFNDIEASIISINNSEAIIRVPSGLEEGNVELKVIVAYQKAIYEQGFTSIAPRISGLSTIRGTWNDVVTIEGVNFSSEIAAKVRIPVNLLKLESIVNVEVNEQISKYPIKFRLQNIEIDSFDPKTATFRDVVKIRGLNFNPVLSNNKVYFGEIEAIVLDVSNSELSVTVPDQFFSASGKTPIRLEVGDLSTISNDEFTLLLQEVSNFTPTIAERHDEITINGNYFNPSSDFNEVFLDEFELTIVSASKNQIVASVPEGIVHGNYLIKVDIAGRTITATNSISIFEPWQKIEDFPGSRRSDAISFAIGNYGYVGGGNFNYNSLQDFYRYDVSSDSWTRLSNIPFNTDRSTGISYNGKAYVFNKNELWEYDPQVDIWKKLNQFPGSSGWPHILFNLNDNIYITSGLIKHRYVPDVEQIWAYNISTNSWIYESLFPAPVGYSFGFVVDGTGYRTSGEYFYKYDQENDLWEQSVQLQKWSASFPAKFSINGKGYTATGGWPGNSDYKIKDAYEYDFLSSTYLKLVDFPNNPRTQTSFFVIGNKAYIGLGQGEYNSYFNDFWEFDPSKIKR